MKCLALEAIEMQIINRRSGEDHGLPSPTKVAEADFSQNLQTHGKKAKVGFRDAWSCKLLFNVILAVQTVPLTQELMIQT